MSLLEKWKALKAAKVRKDALEEELKAVNLEIVQLAQNEIPTLMERSEIEKMTVEGVGTCFLQTKVEAYVLKENEPDFHKWLKKNRHGGLIKPYVFPATLKAFAKEQLEQQKALPDILKVTLIPTASIRKAK